MNVGEAHGVRKGILKAEFPKWVDFEISKVVSHLIPIGIITGDNNGVCL